MENDNEYKEKIKEEREKDIEKFYKYVCICKICGKNYGSDFIEKETKYGGYCPYCAHKAGKYNNPYFKRGFRGNDKINI